MSEPTEKHMEATEALRGIQRGADDPCFVGPCHCRDSIARALSNAEREGMKQGFLAGFVNSGEG